MKIVSKLRAVSRAWYYKLFVPSPNVVDDVRREAITYLDKPALTDLYHTVLHLRNNKVNGIVIEAGCALGGSAIVISKALDGSRSMYVYDTFGMIPPPTDKDGQDVKQRYEVIKSGQSKGLNGNKYYGYENDLLNKVKKSFVDHQAEKNVHFVQGMFEDTMQVSEPVAFAHIDGDWYSSVYTCLQEIAPKLNAGGVMVIDDYYMWSGAKEAVNDYFKDKKEQFKFVKKSRLHIVKK